jgi:uncharacterized iron-regulated membrane protein
MAPGGGWRWARAQLAAGLDPGRPRRARLEARRRLWLSAHRWLGLLAGAALAVIGVTGSILVFYEEVDELLNPALLRADPAPPGAAAAPLDAVVAAARSRAEGWRLGGALAPRDAGAAWDVYFDRPSGTGKAFREVFVDPVSARVHGARDSDDADWLPGSLVATIFMLHDMLLIPWRGDVIVGVLGVLLTVSVLSGLILWWPVGGRLLDALRPRPRATGNRLNLELHRLPGAWTSPVLVAVLVSGVSMNLHDPFVWLVRRFSPGAEAPRPTASSPAHGRAPLQPGEALARAQAAHTGGRLHDLAAPAGPDGVYSFTFHEVPGTSRFWAQRVVTLDAFSGAVLDVRDAANRPTGGDAFLDWQWPLHSGKAFGWPGRALVFLSGLACPLLLVTGIVRFSRRGRGTKRAPL